MQIDYVHVQSHEEGWGFLRGHEIAGAYCTPEEAEAAARMFARRLLGEQESKIMLENTVDGGSA